MNATNETSLTKAPDPVYVFMSSSKGTSSGSGAFNGLEKREELMAGSIPKPDYLQLPSPAEAETAPGRQEVDWFLVAAWDAYLAGYITLQGFERVKLAHGRRHE